MSIAFRAAANGAASGSPMTVTVPVTVQAGDIVLIPVTVDTQPSTFTASTAGTTTPVQAPGSLVNGLNTAFTVYQFTAVSGDAGAVLTFNASASSAPLVGVLAAYSGAGLLQAADIQSFTHAAATSVTSPQFTPAVTGSWGLAYAGINAGGATYSPGTLREADPFGVSSVYDSNGPASPAGGGTWTDAASDVWWGYTIALRPAVTAGGLLMAGFI